MKEMVGYNKRTSDSSKELSVSSEPSGVAYNYCKKERVKYGTMKFSRKVSPGGSMIFTPGHFPPDIRLTFLPGCFPLRTIFPTFPS